MSEAQFWAGAMGRQWAEHVEALDRQLQPASAAGLDVLQPRPGERILDLGCGSGATTAALCAAVGEAGHVTGIDISADQIRVAAARPGNERAAFLVQDAQSWAPSPETFDALFSRFGCMFFDRPDEAFASIRRALKREARLVLLAWSNLKSNPWAAIPAEVGSALLGPAEPAPPGAPGPFAWADPATFQAILEGASFQDVSWSEAPIEMQIGSGIPQDPTYRAVDMLMRIGPLARRVRDLTDARRTEVAEALASRLGTFVRDGWVRMPARIWIVTARVA